MTRNIRSTILAGKTRPRHFWRELSLILAKEEELNICILHRQNKSFPSTIRFQTRYIAMNIFKDIPKSGK